MGKRKVWMKVTATCDKASHYAVAIVDENDVDAIKARCMRSLADFMQKGVEEARVKFEVEHSLDYPIEGVDITLHPVSKGEQQ